MILENKTKKSILIVLRLMLPYQKIIQSKIIQKSSDYLFNFTGEVTYISYLGEDCLVNPRILGVRELVEKLKDLISLNFGKI
ncbi:MAG: hypothetical protein ACYTE5_12325, partial [Planctomycetota bacterium]